MRRSTYFLLAMIFTVVSSGCGGNGNGNGNNGGVPPISITPTPSSEATPTPMAMPSVAASPTTSPAIITLPSTGPITMPSGGIVTPINGLGCTGTLTATPTQNPSGGGGTITGQATVTCNQSGAACTGTVNVNGTLASMSGTQIAGAVQGQGSLQCTQPSISCTASANISGAISGTASGSSVTASVTGSASLNCGDGGSPSPTCSAGPSSGSPQNLTVQLFAYGWPDNTQPNSGDIAHPVIHQEDGGDGSYCNPTTFATQTGNASTLPYGILIYVPSLHRYFIREDDCRDTGCPAGVTTGPTVNVWVGGSATDNNATAITQCENQVSVASTQVVLNPPNGQPVTTGPIYANGACHP